MTLSKLLAHLALVLVFFSGQVSAMSPEGGPIEPNRVTDEEVNIIAMFEDQPLFLGKNLFSRVHYPVEASARACSRRGNCPEGCTIGYGLNLAAHSRQKIMAKFAEAGISSAKAKAFATLSGVTGTRAVAMCGKHSPHRHKYPTLSRAEAMDLLRVSAKEYKANVVAKARQMGVLHKLNKSQLAILVSLDYNCPCISSRATHIWLQIKRGDIRAAVHNIRYGMGSQKEPALQRRRNWESGYFAAASAGS